MNVLAGISGPSSIKNKKEKKYLYILIFLFRIDIIDYNLELSFNIFFDKMKIVVFISILNG